MPGALSEAKNIRCPFFVSAQKGQWVSCEGPTRTSCWRLMFPTAAAYRDYLSAHCRGQYQRCPLFQGLYIIKYPEED